MAPRSYWIHAPSPLPDHRVARLPSTVLAGRFPSVVLAVTAEAPGVRSISEGTGVGDGEGLGVGLGVDVGVGVAVGVLTPSITLTSVTLFHVAFVGSLLPWPT